MADIQHADLTDPELHEPKGAAAAAADLVYVSDGAASGAWQAIDTDQLDTAAIFAAIETAIDDATITIQKEKTVLAVITDISTADTIYVPVPVDATFNSAALCLGGALATADATIDFKDGSGNSMGTGVTVTQSGSAAGDLFSFTPTANADLTGPTYMTIETDGGSDNTVPIFIALLFVIPI